MKPNGMTSFNGKSRPAVNFVNRQDEKFGTVTLVRPAFHGAWFGRCETCGCERVYTKEKIRRSSVRCCP